ncbi:hypothetical protein NK6_6772 [Bradyrhizobium diazoefficiens]|uniref:Uncharacterized protein n=1 Tax=Bradyrhizobium diazoefficiens TaxID=1355477 RepID=A0A0E4BTN1_9BRAD|nr:hypothetical protein NK6_6772 [Bradyrhizobium diazoefficiens]
MSKRHAVMIAMGLFASASALAQTETTGQAGSSPAASGGTVPAAANPAHAAAPKTAASTSAPAGHFKFLRVWSVKFLHPRGRTRDC